MEDIIITLDDNKKYRIKRNTVVLDFCNALNIPIPLCIKANGDIISIFDKLIENTNLSFLDINSIDGNRVYESGLKMIFELSVKKCYPMANVRFLYKLPRGIVAKITPGNDISISNILSVMDSIIGSNIVFEKKSLSNINAIKYFESIKDFVKSNNISCLSEDNLTMYKLDNLHNYYYSEMPYSTGQINKYSIKQISENMYYLNFPNPFDNNTIVDTNMYHIINTYELSKKWLDSNKASYVSDINNFVTNGEIKEFINLSENRSFEILSSVANKIVSNNNIKVVLLSGPSSSGKTTTANRIAKLIRSLGKNATVISLDDYFLNRIDTPKKENGDYDFENLRALDLQFLSSNLKDLLDGKEINIPKFNFVTGIRETTDKVMKLNENDIIIFEGLHALNPDLLNEFSDDIKYKIFVSPYLSLSLDEQNYLSCEDLRLLRRLARDFLNRGYKVEYILKNNLNVREGEEENIIPFINTADSIIDTSLPYEVGSLKVMVEPLLYSVKYDSLMYNEARRLLDMLKHFYVINLENVPSDSTLREFIGEKND